jgi:hypothetical protein
MSSQEGHFHLLTQQRVGSNWHGSVPVARADEAFEPNFRHFDFYLDAEVPDADLVNRVFKVDEGAADWQKLTVFGGQVRAVPAVLTSIGGAAMTTYIYTRLISKSAASARWAFFPCYALIFGYNNFTKWLGRERSFSRDWERNQAYARDELRQKRDEQRVREALYEKKFVTNPLAEYRIKTWQLSERFA